MGLTRRSPGGEGKGTKRQHAGVSSSLLGAVEQDFDSEAVDGNGCSMRILQRVGRVDRRLAIGAVRAAQEQLVVGRERLGGDQVFERCEGGAQLLVARGEREGDAVDGIESAVAAEILDAVNDLAREAFLGERLADIGVERDAADLVFSAGSRGVAARFALDQQVVGAERDALDLDGLAGFDGLGDVRGELGWQRA